MHAKKKNDQEKQAIELLKPFYNNRKSDQFMTEPQRQQGGKVKTYFMSK